MEVMFKITITHTELIDYFAHNITNNVCYVNFKFFSKNKNIKLSTVILIYITKNQT